MKIDGTHYRSLWWNAESDVLEIIDQRWLPHELRIQPVGSMQEFADAIVQMRVRGAPLIGATAAYGMALAMAQEKLHAEGCFLTKLFQGEGSDAFIAELRAGFARVAVRKPSASRDRSREVYALAWNPKL